MGSASKRRVEPQEERTPHDDSCLHCKRARSLNIVSLCLFSPDHLAEIERLVASPKAPPQWITVCGGLAQITSRAWHEWHVARGHRYDRRRGTFGRDAVPRWLRRAVIERDGLICQLCFRAVAPNDVHLDHIRAWSLGGPTTLDNLQVTHSRCNTRKGASPQ